SIMVLNGPVVTGLQTTRLLSGTSTFTRTDFANKSAVIVDGLNGTDTFTVNNSTRGTGLNTLTLKSATTAGVVVNVRATASGMTTHYAGANTATVNVGNAHSVQGIAGTLNLENVGGKRNTVTIDDAADLTSRFVTLTTIGQPATDVDLN